MLPPSARDLSRAKIEVARAKADLAEAEVEAARARLALAVARLNDLQQNDYQGTSPMPSPNDSPRGTNALQSSPRPTLVDVEPADKCVAEPAHVPDCQKLVSTSSGPWIKTIASAGWLACAPSPSCPSLPASDPRGPFMNFGKVRIRYWYVCWACGETPCGIMTTDNDFKYDWNVSPVWNKCCAKDPHRFCHSWNPIIQICALGEEFLIRLNGYFSESDEKNYESIRNMAKTSRLSSGVVRNVVRDVENIKFEMVFEPAKMEDTHPCVDLERTWKFNSTKTLPKWDFDLLYGVVTHCRDT
jgi:hypothetical protein